MRLPSHVQKALEETGLPWEVEAKRRHRFVKLCGRIVLTLPIVNYKGQRGSRHPANNVATIRRAARELKGEMI